MRVPTAGRRDVRNARIARPLQTYRQSDRHRNRTYGAQPVACLLLAADLRRQPRRASSAFAVPVTCYGMSTLQLGLHCSEKLPALPHGRPARARRTPQDPQDRGHLALGHGDNHRLEAHPGPPASHLTSANRPCGQGRSPPGPVEPPATGPTAGLSACSDTEKPLPEAAVAPFRQTPQQRERSRTVTAGAADHDLEYMRRDLDRAERQQGGCRQVDRTNSRDRVGGLRSRERRFESCRGHPPMSGQ